ncbi:MAG: hypothetical protein U0990_09440 [Candidatus Nanopelagicales bacterium]|nr:hypothetical protein [Candidatus Nanopelagicales bacterium]
MAEAFQTTSFGDSFIQDNLPDESARNAANEFPPPVPPLVLLIYVGFGGGYRQSDAAVSRDTEGVRLHQWRGDQLRYFRNVEAFSGRSISSVYIRYPGLFVQGDSAAEARLSNHIDRFLPAITTDGDGALDIVARPDVLYERPIFGACDGSLVNFLINVVHPELGISRTVNSFPRYVSLTFCVPDKDWVPDLHGLAIEHFVPWFTHGLGFGVFEPCPFPDDISVRNYYGNAIQDLQRASGDPYWGSDFLASTNTGELQWLGRFADGAGNAWNRLQGLFEP